MYTYIIHAPYVSAYAVQLEVLHAIYDMFHLEDECPQSIRVCVYVYVYGYVCMYVYGGYVCMYVYEDECPQSSTGQESHAGTIVYVSYRGGA